MLQVKQLRGIKIAYGTTEMLSKSWMPLDEFTKTTVDGLKKGDEHLAAGSSKALFEKYNQGKYETVLKMLKFTESW